MLNVNKIVHTIIRVARGAPLCRSPPVEYAHHRARCFYFIVEGAAEHKNNGVVAEETRSWLVVFSGPSPRL
jgi:hypothetical protein